MRGLLDFKTRCIRQFVAYMKRWLNNWELKQDFLINLRKDFGIENANMHQTLNALRDKYGDDFKEVEELYARIE